MKKIKFQKFVDIAKALQPIHHDYSLNRTFHVTFAVSKKKTISIGINNIKTHPNIKKLNYKSNKGEDLRNIARTHSELNCVLKLQNKFSSYFLGDIVFVNIRLDRMGNVRYSKPCNGCTHLMEQVGYKKLYYSGDCGNFFELNTR
jgi:hypothetical protein